MMLDMSLMRGVWVDPVRRVARAQAGCLLGDVDRETQVHGLATVLGFVSATGVTGLTLGGGFGYLTRRWGWTSDNVIGMDVVTDEGLLVRASDDENPDLFWGLRGGGGNFGVVTSIDYTLHLVGPEVVGGLVAWPASAAPDVLEFYRTLAAQAPPELTLVALMRPAPPSPWLPKEVHGKPIVALLACYSGDPAKGEKILAPLKSFGSPIGDVLVRRPYTQMQSLLDATQPKGRRYYWKSEYLPRIDPGLGAKVIEHAARITLAALGRRPLPAGGCPEPAGRRTLPRRQPRRPLHTEPPGGVGAGGRRCGRIAWARHAWNDLKSFSTGGTYLNFLTEDEGPERTAAALGTALDRLAAIRGSGTRTTCSGPTGT